MRRCIPLLAVLAAVSVAAPASAASFRMTLKTPKSQPRAGKYWHITVGARTGSGKKLHATAWYQFVFNGQVVSTQYPDPKTHEVGRRKTPWPFYGSYSDDLIFPARSVGIPLTVRVVVKVKGRGTQHRDRKVRVRK
jgi:hypothetical protein